MSTSERRRSRPSFSWLGLLPFFAYLTAFFLLPTVVVLYSAFERTDPDTLVKTHTMKNVSDAVHGVYRTALMNSIKVSVVTAIIGGIVGLLLAQAVVSSGRSGLHRAVSTASAVLANFGGIPLAFLFIATFGNAGLLTAWLSKTMGFSLQDDAGFSLYSVTGVELVYLYFQIPLMVLVMTPALEGLKPQWREAAQNLGASRRHYWRHVAGPVLAPSFLGALLLLFCSSFSAFATADALIGSSIALVPNQIAAVLSGNVLEGQDNLGAALAVVMVVVVVPMTLTYQWLQRRTSKWLQ
jgi:putative spermidine/putrescine transport system permease protein